MAAPSSPAFCRDKIITELYHAPDLCAAISNMEPAHLQDDLKQEMFTAICKLDNDKLMVLAESKQLHRFASGIMMRMITRPRTTFYNTHRKYREELLSGTAHIQANGEIGTSYPGYAHTLDDDDSAASATTHPLSLASWDEQPEERWFEEVESVLLSLDPYEAGLFKLYVEHGESCAPVALLTGISQRSIRFAVSQARAKMKKHLTS